jgi:hypothetical protein
MADKKAPATEDGHNITYKLLFLFLILMAVGGLLTKIGFDRYMESVNSKLESGNFFNNDEKKFSDKSSFSLGELFSTGKISLGENVANKKEIEVRNEPAGQILGFQKKGEISRVLEGPVNAFNFVWWRLDYKNAPDGWVKSDDVTAHVGFFNFLNFFPWLFSSLQKILILLGIIALILIILVVLKRNNLRKLKNKKADLKKEQDLSEIYKTSETANEALPIPGLPIGEAPETMDVSNRRWKNIQFLINSHNLNDWKQAIIEADIMLDEMLDKMGYHGDSIGDKLKQIEASDFLTLNQAWEAHKVRNQIAHQGGNYILSRDEAEKVISLYREVFREFYYI